MKAICFKCHYVGIGVSHTRCPDCSYPLIVNSDPVGLGAIELERAFRQSDDRTPAAPLPGLVFSIPKPFLKNKRRPTTRRPAALVPATGGGTSVAALASPGHRIAREVLAASAAFLVGLIITLGAFSAF
jgi:hypothetical protein